MIYIFNPSSLVFKYIFIKKFLKKNSSAFVCALIHHNRPRLIKTVAPHFVCVLFCCICFYFLISFTVYV